MKESSKDLLSIEGIPFIIRFKTAMYELLRAAIS